MTLRQYRLSANPRNFLRSIAAALLDDTTVEVSADEVDDHDELAARRGPATRTFTLRPMSIDRLDGLHILAQDETTAEWATISVSTEIILQVAS